MTDRELALNTVFAMQELTEIVSNYGVILMHSLPTNQDDLSKWEQTCDLVKSLTFRIGDISFELNSKIDDNSDDNSKLPPLPGKYPTKELEELEKETDAEYEAAQKDFINECFPGFYPEEE